MSQSSLPILLLVLLALAGVAYWVSQEPAPEKTTKELALLAELGGAPEEIHTVNKDKSKEYRFVSTPVGWEIRHPVEDEANEGRVRMLLGQLAKGSKVEAFPDGEPTEGDLKEAGLVEPSGIMVLKRGDKSMRIEFGAECFPPGKGFARVDGKVCKIDYGIDQFVEQNLVDLRNPLLFRAYGNSVQELEITRFEDGKETGVFLQRVQGGGFRVASRKGEKGFPADPQGVTRVLASLLGAHIRRFLPLPKEPVTTKPWLHIRLDGNFGRESVVLSDPGAGSVYAVKSERNARLEVDSDSFIRLIDLPVKQLINTQLWSFPAISAGSIRVDYQKDELPAVVLEHVENGPGFRLKHPVARPTNGTIVNDLIAAVEKIGLVEILEGDAREVGRKALEVPDVVIEMKSPAARRLPDVRLALARDTDGSLYGRRNDEASLWRIRSESYDTFETPWWKYVELVAFRYSGRRPVASIEVEQGGRTRLFARGKNGWELDGKTLGAADFEFDGVFDELKVLAAKSILGADEKILEGRALLAVLRPLGNHPQEQKRFPLGVLKLYAGEGRDRIWARSGEEPVIFELGARPTRILREFLGWNGQ